MFLPNALRPQADYFANQTLKFECRAWRGTWTRCATIAVIAVKARKRESHAKFALVKGCFGVAQIEIPRHERLFCQRRHKQLLRTK
jgi:hypothetical protein